MFPVRIQSKFLILVLGILTVLLSVFSVVVIRRETAMLASKNADQEHLLATAIVADLKDNMLAGRPRSTLKLMENIQDANQPVRLAVLREDGTPAFGEAGKPVLPQQVREVFRTGTMLNLDQGGALPRHVNLFPLKNEGPCLRCHGRSGKVLGVILISHPLGDMLAEIRANKRQLMLLFAGALLAIGAALYAAVRHVVLKPLAVLSRGSELIGGGNFNHRIVIKSGDEFQDMAGAFNRTAEQLKESYRELENMVRVRTAELNESVRLMRGILSSMSSGVVLLTADGIIKMINRQGSWILGRGHEDLVGRKLAEVAPETAVFGSVRIGAYEEISIRTPDDGVMIPIGFTVSRYTGTDGGQEGLIIVFQDLTELKMLQRELVDRERFAAIGRVVAGVAHEIRNPLFGISAIGQILERDLTLPAHQELVKAQLAETKRLNQLVEELLIYGRPMKLKLETGDLRLLWKEILDLHSDELLNRGIKLVTDCALRHPLTLFDPYQVRQVLLNLLRNAMEAMPEGGILTITMLLEDNFILCRVADTGAGIPKDQLGHVFDLFFTTKPKGTGLGLAICRRIIQDHGGDISIESEAGAGTTVTIKLPFRVVAWPGPAAA